MSIHWITDRLAIVARPRPDDWLEHDIESLRTAGIDILVSALTSSEEDELGLKNESAYCQACGMEWVSIPIEDRSVPSLDETFTNPLLELRERINQGKAVGIHCRACIGRSSLIAACLLIQNNTEPDEAFFQIGVARGCPVPDTDEQSDWVRSHAEKLRSLQLGTRNSKPETASMKLLLVHPHRFALWNAPAWVGERLHAEFSDVSVVQLSNYDRLSEEIADAEIFVGASLRPEQFQQAKKLRWIHSPSTAVHHLLFPEVVASSVILTNGRTVHGMVVAEQVMALMLALARRLPSALRYQQQHKWGQGAMCEESPMPRELAGAMLLMLGAGSIGREVIPRARAFGMRIVVIRENVHKGAEGGDEVHSLAELDRFLPLADFVLLSAPVLASTRGLFDRERLAKMKSEAYLVNVGRGALIDEAALVECLQKKQIAGAALDVFVTEPLPADSPLWSLENLIITPHTAALAKNLWDRHYALIADNLHRYLANQPLRNLVDKEKGY